MEYKYKAFISYRHGGRDELVAKLLHGMIEEYVIPEELRENEQKHPGKVFWDRSSIGAANDLPQEIKDALDDSEYLIVILSCRTLKSKWCRQEIAHFRENHGQEKVLTVLLGGKPKELMEELLPGMPEQSSVDLRGLRLLKKLWDGVPRICAPLIGCEYSELAPSFLKRRQERVLALLGVIMAVSVAIGGILLWSNGRIDGKDEELAAQNLELQRKESELADQEAAEALKEGDRFTAIQKSIQALPEPGHEHPYSKTAEQVLFASVQAFWDNSINYVFSRTVLDQNTAVLDFCISPEGKLLTTADQFNRLNCFDTQTGTQRWDVQVSDRDMSGKPDVISGGKWGSVLLCCDSYIASVSQETGELLWLQDTVDFSSDLFVFREEAGILACISNERNESYTERSYYLTTISVEDGTVVRQIPIACDEVSYSFEEDRRQIRFPTSDQGKFSTGAFLQDGMFFAGTYYSNDGLFHCYVADTDGTSIGELYSGESEDIYEKVYHISMLGKDSILVVRDHPNQYRHLLLECVSISDGAVLWQVDLKAESTENVCCRAGKFILLGVGRDLYAIVSKTGEIRHTMEMNSEIKDLYLLGDTEFTYLLSDGESTAMWISPYGFVDTSWFGASVYDLGTCAQGQLWNGGSVRLKMDGTKHLGFYMTNMLNGGGYAATVPEDQERTVVIWNPIQLPVFVEQEQILSSMETTAVRFQLIGEDSLVLYDIGNDPSRCMVLDPVTLEQKAEFTQNRWLTPDGVLFLPDGKSYLRNRAATIEYHDLITGSMTEIWEGYNCPNDSARLTRSGDILSAAATEQKIILWLNGQHLSTVSYPVPVQWNLREGRCSIHVAGSGMIAVSFPTPDEMRGFFIYHLESGEWYTIKTELPADQNYEIQIGENEPVFLLMDKMGTVGVYDIHNGGLLRTFRTEILLDSLRNLILCKEDRFLMVYTKEQYLSIYDTVSGERVFWEKLPWIKTGEISCYEDHDGNIFIGIADEDEDGYWISTDTWAVMSLVPDLMLYNPYCDRIIQANNDSSLNHIQVTAMRVPTVAEVIDLVSKILEK